LCAADAGSLCRISADAALSLWHRQKEHMKTAGDVTHADVMTREDGKSKGCGLVTYASEEDAASAIAELNETELCDRTIFVREDGGGKGKGKGGPDRGSGGRGGRFEPYERGGKGKGKGKKGGKGGKKSEASLDDDLDSYMKNGGAGGDDGANGSANGGANGGGERGGRKGGGKGRKEKPERSNANLDDDLDGYFKAKKETAKEE